MLDRIAEVIEHFSWSGPVGLTFPGVVTETGVRTAPNLHPDWVGVDIARVAADRFDRDVLVLNDGDAAGVAEAAHGAARRVRGVVLVLTFGTGVGSALIVDGALVPNTELGHLPLRGKDAEKTVADSVRERKDWSWKKWAKRTNEYLALLDQLFSPDLIVIGGGIAKQPDDFLPLLETRAPIRVAALGNEAGIVGAAMSAHQHFGRRPANRR
jgi:polyphosphate glucokinase